MIAMYSRLRALRLSLAVLALLWLARPAAAQADDPRRALAEYKLATTHYNPTRRTPGHPPPSREAPRAQGRWGGGAGTQVTRRPRRGQRTSCPVRGHHGARAAASFLAGQPGKNR